jgi:hypothetical protein
MHLIQGIHNDEMNGELGMEYAIRMRSYNK